MQALYIFSLGFYYANLLLNLLIVVLCRDKIIKTRT